MYPVKSSTCVRKISFVEKIMQIAFQYVWCDTLNCFLASAFKHIVLKPQRLFHAVHDKLKGIMLGSFCFVLFCFLNSSLHIACSTDIGNTVIFSFRDEILDLGKDLNL